MHQSIATPCRATSMYGLSWHPVDQSTLSMALLPVSDGSPLPVVIPLPLQAHKAPPDGS